MSTPLATRISQEYAAAQAGLPEHVISAERRRAALASLAATGLPGTRDENWRYANLRILERVRFASPAAAEAIDAADLPPPIDGFARLTFVDGVFAERLSHQAASLGGQFGPRHAMRSVATPAAMSWLDSTVPAASAAAVRSAVIRPMSVPDAGSHPASRTTADATARFAATTRSDARFALLNEIFARDAAVIRVSSSASEPLGVEVVFVATAEATRAASYPRLEIEVEAGAQLELIERHLSVRSEANFIDAVAVLKLAAGASVTHYRVQQCGARTVWLDTLSAELATAASYKLRLIDIGAQSARSTVHIRLAAERAVLELSAVAVADLTQVHDIYALIEHAAPRAESSQSFRGIAGGRARVAFNSKVMVHEGAHGSDSRQSLRGLLAGPDAEIDVRPQLEIHTDDVRCSHGATAGKLDDAMLFYLLSRGIARDTALRLLKWAFLEDVVARIGVPELRRHIEQSLASRLLDTADIKELI